MARHKRIEAPPPTMSVAEFRKLTGKQSQQFSDEQITDIVNELTLYADLYIKSIQQSMQDEGLVPKPP